VAPAHTEALRPVYGLVPCSTKSTTVIDTYEVLLPFATEHPMGQLTREHGSATGSIHVHRDARGRLFTVHTLWATRPVQRLYFRRFQQLAGHDGCTRLQPLAATRRHARWIAGPCVCSGRQFPCTETQRALSEADQAIVGRFRFEALEFSAAKSVARATLYEREMSAPGDGLLQVRPLHAEGNGSQPQAGFLDPLEAETLRKAIGLGYYEQPRRATMDDIARALGITKSAVCRRLNRLERAAVERLLAASPGDAPVSLSQWRDPGMVSRPRFVAAAR
jgi:hypothetical protein